MKSKYTFLFLLKLNVGLFLIAAGILQMVYALVNRPHFSSSREMLNTLASSQHAFSPIFAAACVLAGAYLLAHLKEAQ